MPRTIEDILAHADELADRFENEDIDGPRLTPEEYRLYEAARDRAEAEARVAEAVRAARDHGISWAKVGELVGTSGEAARQRYSA
jgi:hypothetical protein